MKTLEKIAMLAFTTVMGSTQINCTTIINPTESYVMHVIEKRDETIRTNLEDIMQSTHQLVHNTTYEREGASEGTPLWNHNIEGTAFAYAQKDGYTYLITNSHLVIDAPNRKIKPSSSAFSFQKSRGKNKSS
jgi:ABC-type proline/glycine betaine transport system ATPase subunit